MWALLIFSYGLLIETVREMLEFLKIDTAGFVKQCADSALYYGGPGLLPVLMMSFLLFIILERRRKRDERLAPAISFFKTRSRDDDSSRDRRGLDCGTYDAKRVYRLHPVLARQLRD